MRGRGNEPPVLRSEVRRGERASERGGINSERGGAQYQTSIIKTSSEGHASSSPSLNTKSKLHTHGYETAGGGGVEKR